MWKANKSKECTRKPLPMFYWNSEKLPIAYNLLSGANDREETKYIIQNRKR